MRLISSASALLKPQDKYWVLPPLDDPAIAINPQGPPIAPEALEARLSELSLPCVVNDVTVGPRFSIYEIIPEATLRIEKIRKSLEDIALGLGVDSVRFAGRYGCGIGLEIANSEMQDIPLGPLLRGLPREYKLPFVVGIDTAGTPTVADLAELPHLLVAGSSGSGKSMFLHNMIYGLMSTRTPDEVCFVLIDPKRTEFAAYNGGPHVLQKVVTEVGGAYLMFKALVDLMEVRYQQLAQSGSRDITEHQAKGGAPPLGPIVVIIDELADLVLNNKEIEKPIILLAQKARACGISIVCATQYPKIQVCSGLVKANFASRVCLRVPSKVNSNVVLDQSGAELLLGRGDLLYSSQGEVKRLQAPYVSSGEIANLQLWWQSLGVVYK